MADLLNIMARSALNQDLSDEETKRLHDHWQRAEDYQRGHPGYAALTDRELTDEIAHLRWQATIARAPTAVAIADSLLCAALDEQDGRADDLPHIDIGGA